MGRWRKKSLLVWGAFVVSCLAGCGQNNPFFSASADALAGSTNLRSSSRGAREEAAEPRAREGRKLVYTANMSLRVSDVSAAEERIEKAVEAAGGYFQRRTASERGAEFTVRVPVDALDGLIDALAGADRVVSRSVSAEDVSERYFDLEGRLKNLRILEERYREYLKSAKTVVDALEVEARLSQTTTELEALEGAFRDLGKRIELATVEVRVFALDVSNRGAPGLGESLGQLFSNAGDVFKAGVVLVAGLVLYGVPLIVAFAAFWFVAFGRLGLVRRLFARVGRLKE